MRSRWQSGTFLVSLPSQTLRITADFEFNISTKNKEKLVVEGHEFYFKRKISLPQPKIAQKIKATSAASPHLHKIAVVAETNFNKNIASFNKMQTVSIYGPTF